MVATQHEGRQWSKKGFVAIDLDGTALVQKIDKHKWYGFMNRRSDLRPSLIEFLQLAQQNGYDILILTARPKLIEKFFLEPGRNWLGTKPTRDIIHQLKIHGIHVADIVRAPSKNFKEGLKGDPMLSILQQYHHHGAHEAEGILFDDQLKQIRDVKQKKHSKLIAYDINSYKDSVRFRSKMQSTPVVHLPNSVEDISALQLKINELTVAINEINPLIYPIEIRRLKKIMRDLTTRLREVEACGYQPEVDWVTHVIDALGFVMNFLSHPDKKISHKDIVDASRTMFGVDNPSLFEPNTKCERTLKNFLVYLTRMPILDDIQAQCRHYQFDLTTMMSDSSRVSADELESVKRQLSIVNDLIKHLESNPSPMHVLELFSKEFNKQKFYLHSTSHGEQFTHSIETLLMKISTTVFFKVEIDIVTKSTIASLEASHYISSDNAGYLTKLPGLLRANQKKVFTLLDTLHKATCEIVESNPAMDITSGMEATIAVVDEYLMLVRNVDAQGNFASIDKLMGSAALALEQLNTEINSAALNVSKMGRVKSAIQGVGIALAGFVVGVLAVIRMLISARTTYPFEHQSAHEGSGATFLKAFQQFKDTWSVKEKHPQLNALRQKLSYFMDELHQLNNTVVTQNKVVSKNPDINCDDPKLENPVSHPPISGS